MVFLDSFGIEVELEIEIDVVALISWHLKKKKSIYYLKRFLYHRKKKVGAPLKKDFSTCLCLKNISKYIIIAIKEHN